MQLHWLIKNKSEDLIIFFNGWSMDEKPFIHLTSVHHDVVQLFDYRDLTLPPDLLTMMQPYKSVFIIAYSLGVWVAHRVIDQLTAAPSFSLAINGTLNPIHDRYGIPTDAYDKQLAGFNEQSIDSFYQSLFSSPQHVEQFNHQRPQRTWQDQLEELVSLKKCINQAPMDLTTGHFDAALISNQDKVISSRNQLRFWKNQCDYHMINAGHFPFFSWSSWEAIINEVHGE